MLYSKVPPSFLAILHLQHRPAATTGVPSFYDCHSSSIPASQQTPSFPPCSQLDRRLAGLELSAVANCSRGQRVVTGASQASQQTPSFPPCSQLDRRLARLELSAVANGSRGRRVVTGASPASPNSLLLPEARLDGHP